MTVIVAERTFPEPLTAAVVREFICNSGWCNDLYGVTHRGSLLGPDGRQVVCFYRAPDAEAVRSASRRRGTPYDRVWSATLHGLGPEPLTAQAPQESADAPASTVLVSRSFAAPVEFDELQGQEAAQSWCLQAHRVRFLQSLVSRDRRRMLCLYAAPDAEAVRHAQRGAGLPFEQIAAVTICSP